MMKKEDRYDSLIQYWWDYWKQRKFPVDGTASWRMVKAQVRAESNFDPDAKSEVGALGLLQLMPATDMETDGLRDAANPEQCIGEGIRHLAWMWEIFKSEVGIERWKFALGAYNAGQGNIIRAQTLAVKAGLDPTQWLSVTKVLPRITTDKNAADTTKYVANIMQEFLNVR